MSMQEIKWCTDYEGTDLTVKHARSEAVASSYIRDKMREPMHELVNEQELRIADAIAWYLGCDVLTMYRNLTKIMELFKFGTSPYVLYEEDDTPTTTTTTTPVHGMIYYIIHKDLNIKFDLLFISQPAWESNRGTPFVYSYSFKYLLLYQPEKESSYVWRTKANDPYYPAFT